MSIDEQGLLALLTHARQEGARYVVGLDEAGRGALAGPLVVGAWVWPIEEELRALERGAVRDSKRFTPSQREAFFKELAGVVESFWAAGFASAREITVWGLSRALARAAERAVRGIPLGGAGERVVVLCDGALGAPSVFRSPFAYTLIGGDSLAPAVARASIVAKVVRDRHMVRLARRYPQWDFARHKGYGTRLHRERIRRWGVCPEHREQFVRALHSS